MTTGLSKITELVAMADIWGIILETKMFSMYRYISVLTHLDLGLLQYIAPYGPISTILCYVTRTIFVAIRRNLISISRTELLD